MRYLKDVETTPVVEPRGPVHKELLKRVRMNAEAELMDESDFEGEWIA